MKQIVLILTCVAMLMLSACEFNTGSKNAEERTTELADSLNTAIAEKDSLLTLLNEISAGMAQIKEMEQILSSDLGKETVDNREQLKNDILLIQKAMQSRREKLDALEAKLKKSANYNDEMKKTIENLRAQLATQEASMAQLQEELLKANMQIEGLNVKVDSLNAVNDAVNKEKEAALDEAEKLTNKLNTCYYVAGSKSELKENKIIETGFLRKTKILEGDFERAYFTKADKRTLNAINLYSKKAKVLTKHPEGSYKIVTKNDAKVLEIVDAAKFWELSNYLIVQID